MIGQAKDSPTETLLDNGLLNTDPSAFDEIAQCYDSEFSTTALGKLLRIRVWETLSTSFVAGQHVLDLACGTGEDAVWLAQQGVEVTALDGSAAMIQETRLKAERAGVSDRIVALQCSLQDVIRGDFRAEERQFDGLLSDFGGLNAISEWRNLARMLAPMIRPGGTVVVVPMGWLCPWEIGWYIIHGKLNLALRRFRRQATAQIGDRRIPIWYPSAGRLRGDFSPWFNHRRTESLGLWLPPTYLNHLLGRWPRLFQWLDRLERKTAHIVGGWGDHYISVMERKG